MIRRTAIALLLSASSDAFAADMFADQWSAGARYGIVVTDDNYNKDGEVWQATIGRTWGPNYAVEVELTSDTYDFGMDYGLKHRAIAFNHMTINRTPLWDPYFLLGIGWIDYEVPASTGVAERTGNNFMFNLGVGGMWELVVPNRVFLRADFRLRYDMNDTDQPGQNGLGDGLFTLGLTVPFGGR